MTVGKKPVVVYGASGYTGRLICEYLRDRGVPFTAAGRDAARVKEAMLAMPGIETADYDVAVAEANVEDLTALFQGAKVVCNVCGPFITHGPTVVEAALKAGVHYLDTTGEQASILDVARNWGPRFAEKGLVAAPSVAYMYAPNEIAARLALETPGVDSLDGLLLFRGIPTYTSTQSIYVQLKATAYYLEDNELRPYTKGQGYEVQLPGRHETHLALPWGGTGLPVWFENDPRVRNVQVLAGATSRPLMEGVLAMERDFVDNIAHLPHDQQAAALAQRAAAVQDSMPPRENPLQHRTTDSVMGRGSLASSHVVLFGTCAYKQTGVLQATAAAHLLHAAPKAVGFASPCAAFGYRELLAALESYGLTSMRRFA
jgi:short subunit dehydrogenase-like uncharacterized protein